MPDRDNVTTDAIRAEGDRLARIDLGLPPLLPPGMDGGYQDPPATPPSREQIEADHNAFLANLIRSGQR